jgi:membrane associated rhomboid family serine protease
MVGAPGDLRCPACQRCLTTLHAGVPPIFVIDQCDHCGGVWFDHKEWEHVEALRQWPEEQRKLTEPPTWANWWVQLILRLPTEFNLRPRRYPVVTIGLIVLCGLIFAAQLALDPAWWLGLALTPSELTSGRGYWALLTNLFLHGNLFHLLFNLYYLYIVGDNVEDALGPRDYLLFYLACGVVANLVHVALHWASPTPILGASGAIAGVMAAYLLLFRRARLTMMLLFWQFKVVAWLWLGFWIAINLLLGLATLSEPELADGVGWWAHIGGFVAGLLIIGPLQGRIVQHYPLLHIMRTQDPKPQWVQRA